MKIKGFDAFLKDNVLAVKRDLTMRHITIEGTTYTITKKVQSNFNPTVWNYYLEEFNG